MSEGDTAAALGEVRRLYLELLKNALTRSRFSEGYRLIGTGRGWHARALRPVRRVLDRFGLELVLKPDPSMRAIGGDYPSDAETMVGIERLTNIERCIVDVLERGVEGDLIETGVWRGGAVIFMRAVLQAHGDHGRTVWVADSFAGLPLPTLGDLESGAENFSEDSHLAVSLDTVRANFARYGLLDEQVRFLPGWFKDTLPFAPIEKLCLLRLDGDMYESTTDALQALYPKVSPGGYVIVDDYAIEACRKAVQDYRAAHAIDDPIEQIDWTGVFWQKSG